jgi:hypothetical protein
MAADGTLTPEVRSLLAAIDRAEARLDEVLGRQYLLTPEWMRASVILGGARSKFDQLRETAQTKPKKFVCAEIAALIILLERALELAGIRVPEIMTTIRELAVAAAAFGCGLV